MKRIYLILTGISLILLKFLRTTCPGSQRSSDSKNRHSCFCRQTNVPAISGKGKSRTRYQPCLPGKRNHQQNTCKRRRPCTRGTINWPELDPTDYQVQLDATEAEYQQIKAEAERVMALYKDNGTTPNANDKAVYGSSKSPPSTNTIKISWLTPGSMLLSTGMSRNACSKLTKPSEPECPSLP